jgi:hypothetical protein
MMPALNRPRFEVRAAAGKYYVVDIEGRVPIARGGKFKRYPVSTLYDSWSEASELAWWLTERAGGYP